MEQIRRHRARDQLSYEVLPVVIPTPRRELPPIELDDEIDTDARTVIDECLLSERDRAILAFEKQPWRHAGAKEQAIRDRFELSSTRYYQVLNALLDSPAAMEHDPVLVGRLRRLRGSRARARGR